MGGGLKKEPVWLEDVNQNRINMTWDMGDNQSTEYSVACPVQSGTYTVVYAGLHEGTYTVQ